jgi:hypothetical protein
MKRIANLYTAELKPNREWLTLRRMLAINLALLVSFIVLWSIASLLLSQQQAQQVQVRNQMSTTEAQLQSQQQVLERALNDSELNQALDAAQQTFVARSRLLDQMQTYTQQNQLSYAQLLVDLSAADGDAIWLQRILVNNNALSLEGHTLQPQQLPSWLASFSRYETLQDRPFGVFELSDSNEQGLRFVVGHIQNEALNSQGRGGAGQ